MRAQILILSVERDGDEGLIVTFSDGTTAAYAVEELLELGLKRESIPTPTAPKAALSNVDSANGETAGRIEWRQTLLRLQTGV
jgi:hypothetical protein